MRTLAALAVLVLGAGLAAADPKPEPAKAEATTTQSAGCKRLVVGRGLDRKVICQVEAPVIVHQEAPKPNVIIVNRGGKNVTGRPKSEDRLNGLSRRRTQ
jgi:predicted secreted protein